MKYPIGETDRQVPTMTRKSHTLGAALKVEVALATVRGDWTTDQLASQFGIHTSQVTA